MTSAQVVRGGMTVLLAAGGLVWMNSLGSLQLPTVLAYSGLVVFCAGLVTVFLPVRWSGFSRRINGLLAGVVVGAALFAAGCLLTKPSGAKQELHLLLLHAQLGLHLPPLHLRLGVHERDCKVNCARDDARRGARIVPGDRLDDG